MATILVTGVAGFIGSSVARALLEKGNSVIGIDEVNDYYNQEWKKANLAKLKENNNFSFFKLDIRNLDNLRKDLSKYKIDAIVHLAARAGVRPSIADPLLYEEVNIRGTINLLKIAKENQIKQFVFASSSSVYGNQSKVPFSETDPVNEPISPYAASKKAGEMFCHTYAHLYDINCICLRFFTVYGPNGRPDMAPYMFTKAILEGKTIKKFGDGQTRRDYTYIDDIVSGVVAAINLDRKFEIINLGNSNPITLNEFIDTLEKITGKKMQIEQLPMQPGDVDQTFADVAKAKKLLGYEAKTSFEEGMKKFVEWYKANRL
ncbi:SDR family NAD(P)-dependent oxidoreductase [Patescibacteria group bacterium]|nr:SDR family NAD(P)-dependent oxidoreductase [Patescibacteria group bacterium]